MLNIGAKMIRPHLMATNIGADMQLCIDGGQLAKDDFHDGSTISGGKLRLPPFDSGPGLIPADGFFIDPFDHILENNLNITNNRNICLYIFPNLGGVDIQVNLGRVLNKLVVPLLPRVSFWFDANTTQWLGHRSPTYSNGPTVLTVRNETTANALLKGSTLHPERPSVSLEPAYQ